MLKSADLHETILTPVVTSRNITNNKTQEASLLHVVLPLTSCDFCSQILSVYERHDNKNAATFKKGIFVHSPLSAYLYAKFKGGLKIFISQDV